MLHLLHIPTKNTSINVVPFSWSSLMDRKEFPNILNLFLLFPLPILHQVNLSLIPKITGATNMHNINFFTQAFKASMFSFFYIIEIPSVSINEGKDRENNGKTWSRPPVSWIVEVFKRNSSHAFPSCHPQNYYSFSLLTNKQYWQLDMMPNHLRIVPDCVGAKSRSRAFLKEARGDLKIFELETDSYQYMLDTFWLHLVSYKRTILTNIEMCLLNTPRWSQAGSVLIRYITVTM